MIDRPLPTIGAADLQRLVDDGVSEGRTLEFKRELPGTSIPDRKEFLADVSSFANAAGGDLIYGVEEKDGKASNAVGLAIANVDAEVLRLDQMIRSGISPRLVGCHVQSVPGLPSGPAIVIRVQRSWHGPHIISYQQDFRFYSRSTNGKFRMDASDVRDAVLNAGSVEERLRLFRADRLARIVAAETPVSVSGTKLICIHVTPFDAFRAGVEVDLSKASTRTDLLQPFYSSGWSAPTFNIDGIYTEGRASGEPNAISYLQLLRSGTIEAVNSSMIPSPSGYPDSIPSHAFPNELFAFVSRATILYAELEVSPPYSVMVSILGAKGVQLGVSGPTLMRRGISLQRIDRDVLMLPSLVLNERPADVSMALRPVVDALWQACGVGGSPDYDDQGKWAPRR